MSKGKQVRVKEETLKLIRMFAGELQLATGNNISDDDAIYHLFKEYRSDLIDMAEKIGSGDRRYSQEGE